MPDKSQHYVTEQSVYALAAPHNTPPPTTTHPSTLCLRRWVSTMFVMATGRKIQSLSVTEFSC